MARGNNTQDLSTLQMALVGYAIEKQRIEEKIREIQAHLKGKTVSSSAPAKPKAAGAKRELSAAARKRISAAQKKRWAEFHKKAAQAAKGA
jgi:hypothetical protein